MNTLQKSIAILTPAERYRGLTILLLVLGMAILEAAGVASVLPFLAVLGNPEMINTNLYLKTLYDYVRKFGIDTPDKFLIFLGIGAFVLIIFSAAYRTVTHYVMNTFIELRRHSISTRLLRKYLNSPYAFFLNRHSGDLSKTVLSEIDQIIGTIFRPIYNMFAYGLVFISMTALLLLVNPLLALSSAGLLGGLYSLVFLSLKKRLSTLGSALVTSNKNRFMAVNEAFGGIKYVKLIGREEIYVDRFSSSSKKFAITHANHHTFNQIPHFAIEAIIFGALLLLTVGLMIVNGGVNNEILGQILPLLGLYAFSAHRMKPAVHQIYEGFASLRYGKAAIDRLYTDLMTDNTPKTTPRSPTALSTIQNHLELVNISYRYPEATKHSLKALNITLPVGSSLGLIGATGAGKTTLVDVILGLLRPTEGIILLDGKPLQDEQVRNWQAKLGYVPQEIFLADMSIKENIAMGVELDFIDSGKLIECAKIAQIHDFIENELDGGYGAKVGERGVKLSGGQRQRIGIARALYSDPEVLIFDEATSALDSVTEEMVMKSLQKCRANTTIIHIAHRISTVRSCDEIILLDRGQIKTKGTYDQLLENSPEFIKMAKKDSS